jgi:hypothetical protein
VTAYIRAPDPLDVAAPRSECRGHRPTDSDIGRNQLERLLAHHSRKNKATRLSRGAIAIQLTRPVAQA